MHAAATVHNLEVAPAHIAALTAAAVLPQRGLRARWNGRYAAHGVVSKVVVGVYNSLKGDLRTVYNVSDTVLGCC